MKITRRHLKSIIREFLEKEWKPPVKEPITIEKEKPAPRKNFQLVLDDLALEVEELMQGSGLKRSKAVDNVLRKGDLRIQYRDIRGHLESKLRARGIMERLVREAISTPNDRVESSSDLTGEYDYDGLTSDLHDVFFQGGMGVAHIDDLLDVYKTKYPLILKDDKLKTAENPQALTAFQESLDSLGAELEGSSGYYRIEDPE